MKSTALYAILFCLFILTGCIRTPVRYQNDSEEFFFRPVSVRIHADSLHRKEQAAVRGEEGHAAVFQQQALKDSMSMLAESTKDLLKRIEKLEEIYIQSRTRELTMEKQLAYVQSENKLLEQKVLELQHVAYAAGSGADMPKIAAPVVQQPFSVAGYDGALALFWEKRYDEAISSFTSLLNGGIEADMADHCEYWIGESHYGKKEFREAAVSFEKVIRITISNKKADAYIMLGQAYERLHEDSKARWAYEELLKTYPDNIHAGLAKSRLHLLNQNKAERQDQKHSTT